MATGFLYAKTRCRDMHPAVLLMVGRFVLPNPHSTFATSVSETASASVPQPYTTSIGASPENLSLTTRCGGRVCEKRGAIYFTYLP
jgi:hypothetical protein